MNTYTINTDLGYFKRFDEVQKNGYVSKPIFSDKRTDHTCENKEFIISSLHKLIKEGSISIDFINIELSR